MKIFSKPNTIDFWKDQCGVVKPSEEDSDSDSDSESAAEAHGDAAAAAKPAKCMKTSIPSVTMEGNVDDVYDKLEGKKMAGYAYIFRQAKLFEKDFWLLQKCKQKSLRPVKNPNTELGVGGSRFKVGGSRLEV